MDPKIRSAAIIAGVSAVVAIVGVVIVPMMMKKKKKEVPVEPKPQEQKDEEMVTPDFPVNPPMSAAKRR